MSIAGQTQTVPAETPAAKIFALPAISERLRVDECIVVIRRPFHRTLDFNGTDSVCPKPDCGQPWLNAGFQSVWSHRCNGQPVFTDGQHLYETAHQAQMRGYNE